MGVPIGGVDSDRLRYGCQEKTTSLLMIRSSLFALQQIGIDESISHICFGQTPLGQ